MKNDYTDFHISFSFNKKQNYLLFTERFLIFLTTFIEKNPKIEHYKFEKLFHSKLIFSKLTIHHAKKLYIRRGKRSIRQISYYVHYPKYYPKYPIIQNICNIHKNSSQQEEERYHMPPRSRSHRNHTLRRMTS